MDYATYHLLAEPETTIETWVDQVDPRFLLFIWLLLFDPEFSGPKIAVFFQNHVR